MVTMENKKRFLINLAYFAVIIVALYLVFKFLLGYLMPFIIAILIAALLQRPARFVHRKTKIPKSICSVVLVVLTYIVAISLIGTVVYFLYQQVYGFFSDLNLYIPSINAFIEKIKNIGVSISNFLPKEFFNSFSSVPSSALSGLTSSVTSALSAFASNMVKSTPQVLISIIVTVVASCYISADYDFLYEYFTENAPERLSNVVKSIRNSLSQTITKVIRGYALLMLLTFVEITVCLYILGVKYAIVIASLISLIDILPILGTGTIVIPWGIIALINGNVFLGIGLLLTYVIITIVRNFLEPKIIGHQVGLYPLVTLVAMFCGLKLFGFVGMLLMPVAVILLINLYRQGAFKM